MRIASRLTRLKDISITRKLYLVVGTMAVLIALELLTLWFSIQTLSSVRALVTAEGLYSKAQKDATYQLQKYYNTHDEEDYKAFQSFMKVPLGDRLTRLELAKKNPDLDIARQGFLAGRVHPEDIDGMIKLLIRFRNISYIKNAINAWTKGDSLIALLIPMGEILHKEISSASPSDEKIEEVIKNIGPINQYLTRVEDEFSFTLGEGSRWLENLLLSLVFLVAITVEVTGLALTFYVSRGITKGLNEINRASKKISGGDLRERARIFSKDEIGQVALAMNQMTEQLLMNNIELTRFAYIASHDLQEPLKTISNYVGLLQEECESKLDEDSLKYIRSIVRATARMKSLISDILEYSNIGLDKKQETIDCNKLLNEVMEDMAKSIKDTHAVIEVNNLPTINGYHELHYLFQNLIGNAIKFRKINESLTIKVNSYKTSNDWLFLITDNGIGIEKAYHDQIFAMFKKLHSRREYPGSGIGLANCKKIIELHGGKIWVTSELHQGSTFYFSIPQHI